MPRHAGVEPMADAGLILLPAHGAALSRVSGMPGFLDVVSLKRQDLGMIHDSAPLIRPVLHEEMECPIPDGEAG